MADILTLSLPRKAARLGRLREQPLGGRGRAAATAACIRSQLPGPTTHTGLASSSHLSLRSSFGLNENMSLFDFSLAFLI